MPARGARPAPFVVLAAAAAVLLGLGLTACDTTSDADSDGIADTFERIYGWDPADPDENGNSILDGEEDPDGDELITRYETGNYQYLNPNGYTISPIDADSDDDTFRDDVEIINGSDPLDPASTPALCGAPSGAVDTNC